MTKLLSLSLLFIVLNACTNSNKGEGGLVDSIELDPTTGQPITITPGEFATYKGTLPCADCPGVETTIRLMNDSSFQKETNYLGAKDKLNNTASAETGTWTASGDTVILDIKNAQDKYLLTDTALVQLEKSGKPINNAGSEKYILRKE